MSFNNLEAYELVRSEGLDDINSEGFILRHKKTGARVVCIKNDDANKVFYIGFRTPPTDSTGVPHIIEHSVLCGSKKYPAKDPFVELAKGSLNTFLNAMTYPDKTVYPVASCNDADFANLMDVYLDAVFYPNIYSRQQIFKQEGWHYEIEDKDAALSINGVVYNEMKGAFSSPDDVLDREIFNSLYPDTCYGVESGGDPEVIPTLTYEDFLDFHRRYYHPSNSYIYLYGNMNFDERLEYIDREYLSAFDRLEIDSTIKSQESFKEEKIIIKNYPVTNDEPTSDNSYLSYNVCLGSSLDEKMYLAFQVIDYALISSPGAVLKQALLDSGICKDVQSSYENGILQSFYSMVVKNSNEKDKDTFVKIINDKLSEIIANGFDKKALRAGINVFEFKFREADFGHYPKGLMYGLQALDSWLYDDAKPFIHIQALATFEFLKNNVDTGYFEELLAKYILNNSHKTLVIMNPERGLTAKSDKELSDKLLAYRNTLTDSQIDELIEDTKALHKYQEEEDPKEILEMLPLLKISDIKKEADDFIYEELKEDGITFLTHDIFTGGIGYLNILFDITKMEAEILPYLGIFKSILGLVDTENFAYADLANEIFLSSGGIAPATAARIKVEDTSVYMHVFSMKAKVLYDKADFAFDMIKEIILSSKFEDKKRLYELIAMIKSRMSAAMLSSGHVVSAYHCLSHLRPTDAINEKVSGVEFFRVIEKLEENFDEEADDLIAKLNKLRSMIFTRENLLLIDYTATADQLGNIKKLGKSFANSLPESAEGFKGFEFKPQVISEAYKTGAKIQYVSKAGVYMDEEHPYTGVLRVLKVIMGYDYLWNQVRVVGGAYGAFASFTRGGVCYFSSYRDPNLTRTLDTYNNTIAYLEGFEADERSMTKYIIGTVADLDMPLTPMDKGARGLDAYLSGDSLSNIQRERDEILGADAGAIRKLAGYVGRAFENAGICVIGGEETIEEYSELFEAIEPLFMS